MTSPRNIKYRASSGEDFAFDPDHGWQMYIVSQPDHGPVTAASTRHCHATT